MAARSCFDARDVVGQPSTGDEKASLGHYEGHLPAPPPGHTAAPHHTYSMLSIGNNFIEEMAEWQGSNLLIVRGFGSLSFCVYQIAAGHTKRAAAAAV